MQSTVLNVYDNIRTPKIKESITINQWFNLIKQSDYSSLIIGARKFSKGHPVYESNKALIPAITYNFTFHTTKSNNTITGATGLLYIDIDNNDFNINSLDKSKVYAYYKSFGGLGYSLLVKVNNLTLNNYNATYDCICNDLGISSIYDKGAKKATQYNVLSYDPNIIINDNSYTFNAIADYTNTNYTDSNKFIFSTNTLNKNVLSSTVYKKEEKAYTQELSTKVVKPLKYTNKNDIEFLGDYNVNWNGFDVIECFIPIHKQKDNRNNSLLSYAANLVTLNPDISSERLIFVLSNVNQLMFVTPVDTANIKRVAISILKQHQAGTLQPIYSKKKIIFAKDAMLNADEKKKKVIELIGAKRTSDSKEKLYSIIEGWDFKANGKITIRAVVKVAGMGNNTVTKYWSEFKDYAAQLNSAYYNPVKPAVDIIAKETVNKPIQAIIRPATLTIPVNETAHAINPDSGADERILQLFSKALSLIAV